LGSEFTMLDDTGIPTLRLDSQSTAGAGSTLLMYPGTPLPSLAFQAQDASGFAIISVNDLIIDGGEATYGPNIRVPDDAGVTMLALTGGMAGDGGMLQINDGTASPAIEMIAGSGGILGEASFRIHHNDKLALEILGDDDDAFGPSCTLYSTTAATVGEQLVQMREGIFGGEIDLRGDDGELGITMEADLPNIKLYNSDDPPVSTIFLYGGGGAMAGGEIDGKRGDGETTVNISGDGIGADKGRITLGNDEIVPVTTMTLDAGSSGGAADIEVLNSSGTSGVFVTGAGLEGGGEV